MSYKSPKEIMIETIESFKYPILLQGALNANDVYPESFFTFFNNDTSSDDFYDNTESVTIWDFDLNFYSTNPTLVNTVLIEAKALHKAQGFIIDGKGYDVLSDEPTHTGRGINLIYIEREV